jgi:hypothetical protein
VLDRPRQTPLSAAVLCLLLFGALAVGVSFEWGWLADIDATGRDLASWAEEQGDGLHDVLRVVELAFEVAAMSVYALVLSVLMYASTIAVRARSSSPSWWPRSQ